eukprot:4565222-Pleurochrysis_carterae.AAC.4
MRPASLGSTASARMLPTRSSCSCTSAGPAQRSFHAPAQRSFICFLSPCPIPILTAVLLDTFTRFFCLSAFRLFFAEVVLNVYTSVVLETTLFVYGDAHLSLNLRVLSLHAIDTYLESHIT